MACHGCRSLLAGARTNPSIKVIQDSFIDTLVAHCTKTEQKRTRAIMTTAHAIPPPFYSPYLDDQCSKIASKPVPWEVSLVRPDTGDMNGADGYAGIPTGQTRIRE